MTAIVVSCLALCMVCVVSLPVATTAERPLQAAFRQVEVFDAVTQEAFPVALWYPTSAPAAVVQIGPYAMQVAQHAPPADGGFALVVISHGSGGGSMNHRDLAIHLAQHGYAVAAPMHPQDNFKDRSGTGSRAFWVGRPKQVSQTLDLLLADQALGPHIRSERVAVVGHSAGGYTALALMGGTPSLSRLIRHCREHPEDANFCAYGSGRAARQAGLPMEPFPDLHDPRITAAVLMAPLGAVFEADALAAVRVPVRLYNAEQDDIPLPQYHAEHVHASLPVPPEYVRLKNAGHFSFITPFPEALQQMVGHAARDPVGVDRAALQQQLQEEIAHFLSRTLR